MRDKNGKVVAHGQQTLVKDKSGGTFFRHTFIIGVKCLKDPCVLSVPNDALPMTADVLCCKYERLPGQKLPHIYVHSSIVLFVPVSRLVHRIVFLHCYFLYAYHVVAFVVNAITDYSVEALRRMDTYC